MKKRMIISVLLALMLITLSACATDSDTDSPIQVNTPGPTPVGATPAPNDKIDLPGVSIQINAPGPNSLVNTPDARGRIAGALMGLWHGLISPVTLILSLFNSNVQIYEVHNNGREYNLGYLLGIAILLLILGISMRR